MKCAFLIAATIQLSLVPRSSFRLHPSSFILAFSMSQFDVQKDYYGILGVDQSASSRDIERFYKQQASQHHPDRGGSEERMKSLNEAYHVLKNESTRREYDEQRRGPVTAPSFVPVSAPAAKDVGMFG